MEADIVQMKPIDLGNDLYSCPHCTSLFTQISLMGRVVKMPRCGNCGKELEWEECLKDE